MQPGGGPRRLLAQGHTVGWDTMNALLNEVTGLPRTSVLMTREQMLATINEEEAVDMMLDLKPGNDAPIQQATGVVWRPLRETYHDTFAWMIEHGYLDPKWAPAIGEMTTCGRATAGRAGAPARPGCGRCDARSVCAPAGVPRPSPVPRRRRARPGRPAG